MKPQKMTKEDKKQILDMWSEMYPSLSVYKKSPVWLMNICGPLTVGLLLNVKSDRIYYYPTWNICNLCNSAHNDESITIPLPSLSINIHYFGLSTMSRDADILKVVENYKANQYIQLSGDVHLSQLLKNLEDFYNKHWYKEEVLKELIYLSVWSGSESVYMKYNEFAMKEFEVLKHKMNVYAIEAFNSMPTISDTQKLRNQVEKSIAKFKLEKLPRRELIIDV